MLVSWLHQSILSSAKSVADARQAIFQFEDKIIDHLRRQPLQEWEADRWMRGVKLKLIRMEVYFFRVGSGKNSAQSLFIRNDQGLNVGFRREFITQMATYVSLITDYGHARTNTRFESRWMDVAVYDSIGTPVIYAENKASEKILDKLCRRLEGEFRNGVPYLPPEEEEKRSIDDPVMKARHIWTQRPRYFWAVCPTRRAAYRVNYHENGFDLSPIDDAPNAFAVEAGAADVIPYEKMPRPRKAWAMISESRV